MTESSAFVRPSKQKVVTRLASLVVIPVPALRAVTPTVYAFPVVTAVVSPPATDGWDAGHVTPPVPSPVIRIVLERRVIPVVRPAVTRVVLWDVTNTIPSVRPVSTERQHVTVPATLPKRKPPVVVTFVKPI